MLLACPASFNAIRFPDKPAIRWSGRSINWVAVNNYVHSTSRYLKEISVKRGDRVVVVREVSPAYYIVLLALWRIGALVCPVAADMVSGGVAFVREALHPDLVISHRSTRKVWGMDLRIVDIEQAVAYGYNDSFLGSEAALDPKIDSMYTALLRVDETSEGWRAMALTHGELKDAPGDLSTLFHALASGEPLFIS